MSQKSQLFVLTKLLPLSILSVFEFGIDQNSYQQEQSITKDSADLKDQNVSMKCIMAFIEMQSFQNNTYSDW